MRPEELVAAALHARDLAYAPYSRFLVGAALECDDGAVITGANVENASYGLTICAERTAVAAAAARGHRRFRALAVASGPGVSLCGACRQVLREFTLDLPIYLADATGQFRETSLARLLPDSFGPSNLGRETGAR
jgi:cytidine deaminase